MAYDLSFWKYEEGKTNVHEEVYARLSDGEVVQGVANLPIEEIKRDVALQFKDWERLDEYHFVKEDEAIEVYMTDQFVRFDCYGVSEEDMNRLIDIMLAYDCCLYDSAINVRFE